MPSVATSTDSGRLTAGAFIDAGRRRGIDLYTGVPCSYLTPLINGVINAPRLSYVRASNEGESIGIAAGAWLAGCRPVCMAQNSGLGNMVNPLTSLTDTFRIPILLIITWRGRPGETDEPQHRLMGLRTPGLLDLMDITVAPFPATAVTLDASLDAAIDGLRQTSRPYALLMQDGTLQPEPLTERELVRDQGSAHAEFRRQGTPPRRIDALERILAVVPNDAALIATTGKCGRELFTLADRPQHFYLVGSMGCASAVGLGVATNADCRVIVLDGDGACLMRMGNMATIGAHAPDNLIHLLLDNGVHDSTGGQATVSPLIDFTAIAQACGYRWTADCDDLDGLETALRKGLQMAGPVFLRLRIQPGSRAQLGRPTVVPPDIARRFRDYLTAFRKENGSFGRDQM